MSENAEILTFAQKHHSLMPPTFRRLFTKLMPNLIMFYKQRFISNDFLTSLFLKKDKQQTSIFSKN